MNELLSLERRAALRFFRASSYLKSIKLYHEDRNYLIAELFGYYYYDLEYYRFMANKITKDANLATTIKATKMSNIVKFLERHNKFAYYHLRKLFDSDEWKKFASEDCKLKKKKPKYIEDNEDE